MNFKGFILKEENNYLSQRVGDILNSLQSLAEEFSNLSNKDRIRHATGIVNRIRLLLKDTWDESELQYLKIMQKIGVAIMSAVDGNQDLEQTVASAQNELENLVDKLQAPVNDLGAEKELD